MKEKDKIRLGQPETEAMAGKERENRDEPAKTAGRAVFLLVAALFGAVMLITYFFEVKFGKTAGTASLVIIALIIAFCLYKKEIMEKLKRRK